jgi:class 3 adenylate cyclase/tetratricopeptide (TPR) repeat protein
MAEPAVRRHLLTIMFCDMVGSTALAQRLAPEAHRAVMARFQDGCCDVVERWGGTVAQFLGDGVLAYFGWPALSEEDADRAAAAAQALVARAQAPGPDDLPVPALRIGLATGEVLVGDLAPGGRAQELAATGPATNLAARLMAEAQPGQIVLCGQTRGLLADRARVENLGRLSLEGFDAPVEAFALLYLVGGLAAAAGPVTLTGREAEVAWLCERAMQAMAGAGVVAVLEGEAGIGKSTLAQAAIAACKASSPLVLSLRGSALHRDSPYWPLRQALPRGIASGPPGQAPAEAVVRLLNDAPDPQGTATDPGTVGRLQLALAQAIAGSGHGRPLVILAEDLHWFDRSTLSVLGCIAAEARGRRLLLLATTRPTERAADLPGAETLALGPLAPGAAERLIDLHDKGGGLSPAVRAEIARKSAGNPFFIEHLVRAGRQSGTGVADPKSAGALVLSRSLVAWIESVPGGRALAATAALIGERLSEAALAACLAASGTPAAVVATQVQALVRAGVLTRPDDGGLAFRHALVQEALVSTMGAAERAELHGRIARALAAQGDAEPSVLAHHLAAAGLYVEAAWQGLTAGRAALARGAFSEARGVLEQAAGIIGKAAHDADRDRLELELRMALGLGLMGGTGYSTDATITALERARELIRTLGAVDDLPRVTTSLTAAYFNRAEYRKCMALRQEFLTVAELSGDPAGLCIAHRGVATMHNVFGHFALAREHGARAWSHYDFRRDGAMVSRYPTDIGVAAAMQFAIALWHRDEEAEALRMVGRALAIARQLDHKNSIGYALSFATIFDLFLTGDAAGALASADELRILGETYGMAQWTAWGGMAMALAMAGDADRALATVSRGIGQREGLGGNRALGAVIHVGIATVFEAADRLEAAEAELRAAGGIAEQAGERWVEANRLLLQARIHRRRGAVALAEAALAEAAAVAEAQGSPGLGSKVRDARSGG